MEKETLESVNDFVERKGVTKTVVYNIAVKTYINSYNAGEALMKRMRAAEKTRPKRQPAYWSEIIPGSFRDMIIYHTANYKKNKQDDRQLELF